LIVYSAPARSGGRAKNKQARDTERDDRCEPDWRFHGGLRGRFFGLVQMCDRILHLPVLLRVKLCKTLSERYPIA
jgi:hypothetical protein